MKRTAILMLTALLVCFGALASVAGAASKEEIDSKADAALQQLYQKNQVAKMLGEKAVGVLVFPRIIKGGLIVGGQWGDGVLREGAASVGYYRSVAVSYGLQAGGQKFGYALFFMKPSALEHLKKSEGWEIGVGPTVVVVDKGVAKNLTTTTAKADVYAFVFSQKGLMAGVGLQGTKITRIEPE